MSLGGGVLSGGCVQEEIRFSISTELIACCYFCEVMNDNEAIIISGTDRFSKTTGYAFELQFGGNFVETNPLTTICAIDARDYRMYGLSSQFKKNIFEREVKKAYTGFFSSEQGEKMPVATGNWGCGAFLGDAPHKSIIQYLAASEAERDMIYYTFSSKNTEEMIRIGKLLSDRPKLRVRDLWKILVDYEAKSREMNIFQFIEIYLKEWDSKKGSNIANVSERDAQPTVLKEDSTSRNRSPDVQITPKCDELMECDN